MFSGRKSNECRDRNRKLVVGSKQRLNVDMATQEVQSKCSLFERIRSLENRLTQLSTEIEYCKTSSSTEFKLTERICPYPTFNNPLATYNLIKRNRRQVDINKLKFQKEPKKKPQNEIMKRSSATTTRQHPNKNGDHNKASSNKRRKSKVSSRWPKFRWLGC